MSKGTEARAKWSKRFLAELERQRATLREGDNSYSREWQEDGIAVDTSPEPT